jgi:hypothetical protein
VHEVRVSGPRIPATQPATRGLLHRDSLLWLALVCLLFLAAELTPALLRMPLGADEITYIARTSIRPSPIGLPPVHGQGAGLLAAPVTLLTTSLLALRVWMSLLSAVGLFLALLCWRGLRPVWLLALAGLILASLAITQNSGVQVYPDWWGALGLLALTALFLHGVNGTMRSRLVLPLITLASLVIVVMRPQNVVFLMGPVIIGALALRRWRKFRVIAAMAVGIGLGFLEWLIGAYLWFGGLTNRIHLAGQEPPALRLYPALGTQLRFLNGPWYCSTDCTTWSTPLESPWWIAFLAIALLGLWAGWHAAQRASSMLAGVTALWVFLLYAFLVPFGAPRYLLPTLALMAILAADGIVWAITESRWRKPAIVATCVFLVSGMVTQRLILQGQASYQRFSRQFELQADQVMKTGVKPPCVMESTSIAWYAGCSSPQTGTGIVQFLAQTPQGLKDWRLLQLPGLTIAVYVPYNSPLFKLHDTTAARNDTTNGSLSSSPF